MSERRTVLIADDHPPTRAGVRAALSAGGFDVCAEVGDAAEAIAAAAELKPDIALLDIDMPGDGISAIAPILAAAPDTFVVMLTASEDGANLFRSLREGASGYLLKDTDPERLPIALKGVLEGEAALPRSLAALLIEEFRMLSGRRRLPLIGGKRVDLTPREWEILNLLEQGATTKQMAEKFTLSTATIRSHVAAILRKLDAKDRSEAIERLRGSR